MSRLWPNFNGGITEFKYVMGNYITRFYIYPITYPCPNLDIDLAKLLNVRVLKFSPLNK